MPSGSAPGPGSGTCADASSYAASRRLSILSSAPVSVRKFACSPRLHPYLRSAACSNSAREVQPVPCKEHFPEPGRTLPGPNPGTVRKPARALSRAHTPNQVLALPGSCPDHAPGFSPGALPRPCPKHAMSSPESSPCPRPGPGAVHKLCQKPLPGTVLPPPLPWPCPEPCPDTTLAMPCPARTPPWHCQEPGPAPAQVLSGPCPGLVRTMPGPGPES